MAVSDTDINIAELHTNGGGGGGGDINLYSSRNTIEIEELDDGFDINTAGSESLRIYVKNFEEMMRAVVYVGDLYAKGDSTSCVIQLLKNIDMTIATSEDENTYKVGSNKIIDLANKKFKFRMYLKNTSIISDGAMRALQTIYPVYNGETVTKLDTWSIEAESLTIDNVWIGGSSPGYNDLHPDAQIPKDKIPDFSDYLLRSNGNLDYKITNCYITACGANQDNPNSFNKFLYEGTGSNFPPQYHSNIRLVNCEFRHGTDSAGSSFHHLNAPIVINANHDSNHQRNITLKQLSKQVNETTKETGVPNIQIRPDNTITKGTAWQVTTDGTCLISHSQGSTKINLKSRVAINDMYIQGQPDYQPDGATNTYNWVSLTDVLGSLMRNSNKLTNTEISEILSSGEGAEDTKFINSRGLAFLVEYLNTVFSSFVTKQDVYPFTLNIYFQNSSWAFSNYSEVTNLVSLVIQGYKVFVTLRLTNSTYQNYDFLTQLEFYLSGETEFCIIFKCANPLHPGTFKLNINMAQPTSSTITFTND